MTWSVGARARSDEAAPSPSTRSISIAFLRMPGFPTFGAGAQPDQRSQLCARTPGNFCSLPRMSIRTTFETHPLERAESGSRAVARRPRGRGRRPRDLTSRCYRSATIGTFAIDRIVTLRSSIRVVPCPGLLLTVRFTESAFRPTPPAVFVRRVLGGQRVDPVRRFPPHVSIGIFL